MFYHDQELCPYDPRYPQVAHRLRDFEDRFARGQPVDNASTQQSLASGSKGVRCPASGGFLPRRGKIDRKNQGQSYIGAARPAVVKVESSLN